MFYQLARHVMLCLALVQPRKRPDLTENVKHQLKHTNKQEMKVVPTHLAYIRVVFQGLFPDEVLRIAHFLSTAH